MPGSVSTGRGDKPATAVATVGIAEGVSLTLLRYADGWRFSAWSLPDGAAAAPPPPLPDLERHFPTPEAAATYFRSIWPVRAQ
jgi:hypothetical protein